MSTSQKRAVRNYRSRLGKRGLARFEVLGRDADRDLIRSLARRLAEDSPEASQLRATVSRTIAGEPPRKGGSSPLSAGLPWSAQTSISRDPAKKAARSTFDALPARHRHHQQRHQAHAFRSSRGLDGRPGRHRPFISSLTVAEIRRGVPEKPAGKKRHQLETWFSGPEGPQALFADRIFAFDEKAALIWVRLMADGTAKGRPRGGLDTIIAAVAEANDCVVVTDNEKGFFGIEIVNPMRSTI